MRKADYALLARIIRDEWAVARHSPNCAELRDALRNIAQQFAKHAHVNAPEFLRAAGIELPAADVDRRATRQPREAIM